MQRLISKRVIIFKQYIYDFINKGQKRSIMAKKNIIASFVIKGVSIIIAFINVRVLLDYLGSEKYGIWITISSFFTWFTFFEVGLGNGLRNRLSEALALNKTQLAKEYVSTSYFTLLLIVSSLLIIFFIINPYLNWVKILNTPPGLSKELFWLTYIVISFFLLRFFLQLIIKILYAVQLPAIGQSFGPIANTISLILILIFTTILEGNLLLIGFIITSSHVLILLSASLLLFGYKYKSLRPSLKNVKKKHISNLMGLGLNFFLIQLSGIIIMQTSTIIIAQLYSPSQVTQYHIAFKLFSIILMIYTIISSPMWSAYSEAWINDEKKWIKSTITKLLKVWLLLTLLAIVLLFLSDKIYYLWTNKKINIPFNLSLSLMFFFLLNSFGNIFLQFTNGISKLRMQLICSIIGSFVFVIIIMFFKEILTMGVWGVVIAQIIVNFKSFIIAPIQYKLLIDGKAKGIWKK